MIPIPRTPQADLDIIEITAYIELDSPEAADRFFASVRSTAELIARHPHIGHPWAGTVGGRRVRSIAVEGFPNHLMFYREDAEGLLILRILHGARDLPRELAD